MDSKIEVSKEKVNPSENPNSSVYRELQNGEVIQEGDEYMDFNGEWVASDCVGQIFDTKPRGLSGTCHRPHRRRELGLETEYDPKDVAFKNASSDQPEVDSSEEHKPQPVSEEWDGWNDFSKSKPIEDLKEYLVCVERIEGDRYPFISVWHDGKWWKTSQMPMPFKVTHFKEVEMPKTKSESDKRRDELVSELENAFSGKGNYISLYDLQNIADYLIQNDRLKEV